MRMVPAISAPFCTREKRNFFTERKVVRLPETRPLPPFPPLASMAGGSFFGAGGGMGVLALGCSPAYPGDRLPAKPFAGGSYNVEVAGGIGQVTGRQRPADSRV